MKRGILHDPHSFINSTPHMSFVWGDNVDYLQKRYNALQQTTLFGDEILHRSRAN